MHVSHYTLLGINKFHTVQLIVIGKASKELIWQTFEKIFTKIVALPFIWVGTPLSNLANV